MILEDALRGKCRIISHVYQLTPQEQRTLYEYTEYIEGEMRRIRLDLAEANDALEHAQDLAQRYRDLCK